MVRFLSRSNSSQASNHSTSSNTVTSNALAAAATVAGAAKEGHQPNGPHNGINSNSSSSNNTKEGVGDESRKNITNNNTNGGTTLGGGGGESSSSASSATATIASMTTTTTSAVSSSSSCTTAAAAPRTTSRREQPANHDHSHSAAELARYVPLRLTTHERALLNVLEQTLNVSEYTDHVDVTSAARRGGLKARRILDGILEVCHIATGLAMASGQEGKLWAELMGSSTDNDDAATSTTMPALSFSKIKLLRKKSKNNKNNTAKNSKVRDAATGDSTTSSSSWAGRDPADNAVLFQTMFEIGRRNKVLNPSSMRTTYGKLMYILQDAQNPTVAKSLGFSLHKELQLVGPYLEEHGCAALLTDPRLECAIQYISDRDPVTGTKLDRVQVQAMVTGKQRVTQELVEAYSASGKLSPDEIRRAIESLADAIAYIESNVYPVKRMLQYLEDNFDPNHVVKPFSLSIRGSGGGGGGGSSFGSNNYRYGMSAYGSSFSSNDGPKLTHSHSTQYTFVWQSLRLWCRVQQNMHRLWVCADDDLLSTTSSYHLFNTGQGLNRVQNCPRVRKVMTNLLNQTQQEAGGTWVGLSVIHLGDRDVPNALIFIDKYTQIPRFLSPIVHFIQGLPELCRDERILEYVETEFGSVEALKMTVLADYFKFGFDGSGDDGGSCIDGRLTSSWNWTSRVAKKSYYHAFMLSGFQGFDGDFR